MIPSPKYEIRDTRYAIRLMYYALRLMYYAPLLALILLAIYPLLTGGLPTTGDGLNHFYRFAELDWHIRQGDLYPRWFANMHYGFGAPVFNFYAPLSYYIPLIFRLLGLSLATSLQLGYALAVAVAIVGAYQWAAILFPTSTPADARPLDRPTPSGQPQGLPLPDYPTTRLLTAAAYGLAPYFYFNIFHRGAYPETWALALAPWIFWSIARLISSPVSASSLNPPSSPTSLISPISFFSRFSFLPSLPFILLFAALILTHTLSALILAPLIFLYSLTLFYSRNPYELRFTNYVFRFTFSVCLSLLLTAFFLLPLLFESQFIQLSRTYSTGDLDYHRNFLTLSTLLSPPPNFDPRLVFNAIPPSLGWPQLAFGLLVVGGLLLGTRRRSPTDRPYTLSIICHSSFVILLSLLTLSFTEPLWNLFPFSRFIQFPWRLVGPASLFLAILAGASHLISQSIRIPNLRFGMVRLRFAKHPEPSEWTPQVLGWFDFASRSIPSPASGHHKFWGFWILGFWIFGFFLFSLPWTYHANFSPPSYAGPADTIKYEITSGQLGTASTAEYLPRWVAELPNPQTLLPKFTTAIPSRLTPLPPTITNYELRINFNSEELFYTAVVPSTLTFNLFYFPGWTATLDGLPIDIQPSTPTGLITVAAPAGQHTLRLSLQLTPPQRLGAFISLAALLALLAFTTLSLLRACLKNAQSPSFGFAPPAGTSQDKLAGRSQPRGLGWGAIIKQALSRRPTLATHPPQSQLRDTRHETRDTRYESRITDYGLRITFYISLLPLSLILLRFLYLDRAETVFHHANLIPNPLSVNFDNQLELIGYEYEPRLVSGSQLPVILYWRALAPLTADYSTTVQLADRFGNRFGQSDSQHPNGVPTSRWTLDQYARDTHHLVSLVGAPPGNYRLLITVYSETPLNLLQEGAPVGVEYELGPVAVIPAAAQVSGPLGLADYQLAADKVAVGDELAFTALWQAGNDPLPRLTAAITLANDSGQSLLTEKRAPAGPDYPTEQWQPGALVRYPFSLTLPPHLPAGAARVSLALIDESGRVRAGPYPLGTITVLVPERSFDIPLMQYRADYDFAESIRLLGYDLAPDSITLYWQALQPVSKRLTIFVHELDTGGKLIKGHDAAPQRSTPGWLPGEVIVDVHPIFPGNRFEVGLYDPITGDRFGEPFLSSP